MDKQVPVTTPFYNLNGVVCYTFDLAIRAKYNELKVYMDTYKPAYAIKLSAKNFGFEDNKKIVPLYAAFCI